MLQITNTCKAAESYTHTHTHGCLCKIIFSAIFAIATTIPTYATNISDSNKGCTSGNLTTSSGTAALEADWQANTVGVTFYSDNTQFDTASCTYDGTLTLPSTDPTKTGYTFAGWKVKSMGFDLSTWDYGSYSARGFTRLNGNAGGDETKYGLTVGSGEWAAEFTNGTVKGVATCSATGGDNHNYEWGGDSADWSLASDVLQAGQYNPGDGSIGVLESCWCMVTGYAEHTDGNYSEYIPVLASRWVLHRGQHGNCAANCATGCAGYLNSYDGFRAALFGQSN